MMSNESRSSAVSWVVMADPETKQAVTILITVQRSVFFAGRMSFADKVVLCILNIIFVLDAREEKRCKNKT